MPLCLRAGCCSQQGPYRQDNEDHAAVARWADAVVCVVADGMGGAGAGRLASERAVATLLANLDKPGHDRAGAGIEAALRTAFARANDAVLAAHVPGQRGGSTATLSLWLRGADRVHVAHVGDTRAYHLSDRRLTVLTEIHDVRNALVRNGTLTPEQARTYSIRNVLYRDLGSPDVYDLEPADLTDVPIRPGDRFLLCCDGVYNLLDDGAPPQSCASTVRRSSGPKHSVCGLWTTARGTMSPPSSSTSTPTDVHVGGLLIRRRRAWMNELTHRPTKTRHRPIMARVARVAGLSRSKEFRTAAEITPPTATSKPSRPTAAAACMACFRSRATRPTIPATSSTTPTAAGMSAVALWGHPLVDAKNAHALTPHNMKPNRMLT